jgi:hypothetical protein
MDMAMIIKFELGEPRGILMFPCMCCNRKTRV